MDDHSLIREFLAHRVEPAGFDHLAHVRVAWLLLEQFPFELAMQKFEAGAMDLATRAGVPEKYHATITRALMQIIAADRDSGALLCWQDYQDSGPVVLSDAKSTLLHYYSVGLIFSEPARLAWCKPDLRPLPVMDATEILRSA
jgi:hypothetical protein